MSRFGAAWNRFWFAEGPTHRLDIVRVFFGVWLIMKYMGWWGLHRLDQWQLLTWPKYTRKISKWDADPSAFTHAIPGFEWLTAMPFELFQLTQRAMPVLGLLMVLGLFSRMATRLAAVGWLLIFLSTENNYSHHGFILAFVLVILAFAPVGDHYSLDARLRKGPPPRRRITAIRLLQVLLTFTYFSAFVGKLNGVWFRGEMMQLLYDAGKMRGPLPDLIMGAVGSPFLCYFTLLVEGALPVLLWLPRFAMLAFVGGAMLHLGIDALMPVTVFSYMMISLYTLFIDPVPHGLTVTLGRDRRVLRRVLLLLDWFDRLDLREGDGPLRVRARDGFSAHGPRAAIELGLRLPLTFLPCFVLGLPRSAGWRPRSGHSA